jgi:hypothetical protein
MPTKKILGQESWILRTPQVEAAVTQQAGHLAPVKFRLGKRWVQPYHIAPWAGEKLAPGFPDLLRVLRGDFFCMPFGGNETPYKKEKYPPHGETANAAWKIVSATGNRLHVRLKSTVRAGRVDKIIRLVPGQTAIYSQHIISGMKGPMSFGHHANLAVPKDATGRVSISPFHYGQVFPGVFEEPAKGGYSSLKPGVRFSSLQKVPRADGANADLSVYPEPARDGYEDIALMASDPKLPFAWTALVVPEHNYVWFALKDPRVLPSTLFWMSNGGRHYAPWNGRHRRVIGLEEIVSHFHSGLAESAQPNALNRAGIRTVAQLDPRKPTAINYIMALAEIPRGFDIVQSIRASADKKSVTLTSKSGRKVAVEVDVAFLSAPAAL